MRVTKGARAKRVLALALCAPLALMPVGCAGVGTGTSVSVTSVATDVSTIANGLAGAFASIPGVPSAVSTALTDLSNAASAMATATTQSAQQTVVQQVETDVNAIVKAASAIPGLPAQVTVALTAAQVLLPVIEAAVNLIVPASAAAANAMTPDVARLVLKADAQLKPVAPASK
jgi:hypothetical protein